MIFTQTIMTYKTGTVSTAITLPRFLGIEAGKEYYIEYNDETGEIKLIPKQ